MSAHRRLLYFGYALPVFIVLLGTGSESNPTDQYGLYGESFHLHVDELDKTQFIKFQWQKDSNIVLEYFLQHDYVQYYVNEEKLEFDKKTFSLLIKNLENTDSGLYRAETVNDDGGAIHVVTYKLRVQDKSVVNGIMGQSATLPSGLPEELNLRSLRWRRNGMTVAQKNHDPSGEFKDRALLNPSDWSLTINPLRVEDSGDYTCVAIPENGPQLPSNTVTLRVYEMIASVAIKTNVSKTSSNETCALTLLCTAEQHKHTSFSWKRGGLDVTGDSQTALGSTLEVTVGFEDQNLIYTCKAANPVSQKTATVTPWKKCFNKKEENDGESPWGVSFCVLKTVLLSLGLVLMISAVIGVHVRDCAHTKRNVRRHRAACET